MKLFRCNEGGFWMAVYRNRPFLGHHTKKLSLEACAARLRLLGMYCMASSSSGEAVGTKYIALFNYVYPKLNHILRPTTRGCTAWVFGRSLGCKNFNRYRNIIPGGGI